MHGRAGAGRSLVAAAPHLAYAVLALWAFAGPVFEGRVLFFRDLSILYLPNYVFLSRALAQGVWPLWNPAVDAGAPFLTNAYPLDLLLLWVLGPQGTLAFGPPLHLLLAQSGAFLLARRLGMDQWGAWTAGACFGLGGYLLSCVNLLPLFQAAALAPWVLFAALALLAGPSPRTIAATAALAALQVSTIAGEIVILTWLALPFLASRPSRRALAGLGAAGVLAVLLAAPVLFNVRAALADTQRAAGFDPTLALGFSAPVPVILEALVPRFLGDVHAFTDRGFWGQPFFPEGNPYLLSLYLGPSVLAAALAAGRRRAWLLVALGLLLTLGAHGPLSPVLAPFLRFFRAPVKAFFLCALGTSLLAGFGVTRRREGGASAAWSFVPGAILAAAGLLLAAAPTLAASAFGWLLPELRHPRALLVAQTVWPSQFGISGLLALGTALALGRGARLAGLAALPLCLDLLIVNGAINPAASREFYDLRPSVKQLVQSAEAEGRYRWFSYGIANANAAALTWAPEILRRNTDVWLYYLDRQSLLPRTHVLDGLEGAYDNDHTGMAPLGSTLEVDESRPERFPACYTRLRLANVRWVLSFDPLPEDLVSRRGEAVFPELKPPLALYELRDPLPRAFWVGRAEVEGDPERYRARLLDSAFPAREAVLLSASPPGEAAAASGASAAEVVFEAIDPHHVRLRVSSPPGFVVVLVGHHPDWKATGPSGEVPLLRADGRYWALPTPGGEQEFHVRFAPRWPRPAFLACALGGAACALLALRRGV
jgi:hypothetical protein